MTPLQSLVSAGTKLWLDSVDPDEIGPVDVVLFCVKFHMFLLAFYFEPNLPSPRG